MTWTFYIILVYVLLAAFALSKIEKKPVVHTTQCKTWESVKEGLSYVFQHKILLAAISLDLFAVLFGGAVALIPEFADTILQVGPIGFGWLNAAIDIGSVIMIIIITLMSAAEKPGADLIVCRSRILGYASSSLDFPKFYWISFVALLVAGMLDGISVVIRGTILQFTTPDEMRGRVSSVNSMFINSSNELGQFESGFTARLFGGARPAVIFGGIMTRGRCNYYMDLKRRD